MRVLLTVAVGIGLGGCVYVNRADSYRPYDSGVNASYNKCYSGAQQPYAEAHYSGGSGAASMGMRPDHELLLSCMRADGYDLRTAGKAEMAVGIVTFPLWVWFVPFGAVNDVELGGGKGGP